MDQVVSGGGPDYFQRYAIGVGRIQAVAVTHWVAQDAQGKSWANTSIRQIRLKVERGWHGPLRPGTDLTLAASVSPGSWDYYTPREGETVIFITEQTGLAQGRGTWVNLSGFVPMGFRSIHSFSSPFSFPRQVDPVKDQSLLEAMPVLLVLAQLSLEPARVTALTTARAHANPWVRLGAFSFHCDAAALPQLVQELQQEEDPVRVAMWALLLEMIVTPGGQIPDVVFARQAVAAMESVSKAWERRETVPNYGYAVMGLRQMAEHLLHRYEPPVDPPEDAPLVADREKLTGRRLLKLRQAVSAYYGSHEGVYPSSLDVLVGAGQPSGLTEIPLEPLSRSRRVVLSSWPSRRGSPREFDGGGGWGYDPQAGEVWINLKGQDSSGKFYLEY